MGNSLRVVRAAALVLLPVALGLSGCVPDRQKIEADDQTFFPGARAFLRYTGREPVGQSASAEEADPAGSAGEGVRTPAGAELAFQAAWGETATSIDPGLPAELNRLTIVGPAEIDLDYEIYSGSAAFRGGVWFGEILGIEGLGGFRLHQVNLRAESGGLSDSDDLFSLGPLIGGQLSLRPLGFLPALRWLTGYGRIEYSYEFAEDGKDSEVTSGELGVELGPFSTVGIYAAWRWWVLDRERSFDDSEVELNLNGPAVGILVTF